MNAIYQTQQMDDKDKLEILTEIVEGLQQKINDAMAIVGQLEE